MKKSLDILSSSVVQSRKALFETMNKESSDMKSDVQGLAFENFTYHSSCEDDLNSIDQRKSCTSQVAQINSELLKKTIKSIKRKDKLRKNTVINPNENNLSCGIGSLAHGCSMPDLSNIGNQNNSNEVEFYIDEPDNEIIEHETREYVLEKKQDEFISSHEYEKKLRKFFRNKSLSRSLRRAKSVYYRNIRSKSLEDLSVEDRNLFLMNENSNLCMKIQNHMRKLSKSREGGSQLSINSSSSLSSNGFISDISSSYFHELSDWSPDFSSSESESSENDEPFNDIDLVNRFNTHYLN